ncbi:MAG: geranylgeranylglyceryl phosphate synthase family protein [Bacteroidia bacterium]|nr:geranylgeranylglyceryl phosphate synthase family protein [Bacteroidia bacterium]MDW8088269.1 geranylgeranylglyceryl/heptaprenylglyceryl phosphate synthase [Bacteroidia bacterium]
MATFPLGRWGETLSQSAPRPVWLIDPDYLPLERYPQAAEAYLQAGGKWALVGGSLAYQTDLARWCEKARPLAPLPLLLFPGSPLHLNPAVDAVLFLFLASGRNPYYLIGAHVEAAPLLYRWRKEVLPTTYLLVGTLEHLRTVHYLTHTLPIPPDRPELLQATALAGLYLGQRFLYVDAGSGAKTFCPPDTIQALRAVTSAPLFVGGGIRTAQAVAELIAAGATFPVIGTAAEKATCARHFWEEIFALCPST